MRAAPLFGPSSSTTVMPLSPSVARLQSAVCPKGPPTRDHDRRFDLCPRIRGLEAHHATSIIAQTSCALGDLSIKGPLRSRGRQCVSRSLSGCRVDDIRGPQGQVDHCSWALKRSRSPRMASQAEDVRDTAQGSSGLPAPLASIMAKRCSACAGTIRRSRRPRGCSQPCRAEHCWSGATGRSSRRSFSAHCEKKPRSNCLRASLISLRCLKTSLISSGDLSRNAEWS